MASIQKLHLANMSLNSPPRPAKSWSFSAAQTIPKWSCRTTVADSLLNGPSSSSQRKTTNGILSLKGSACPLIISWIHRQLSGSISLTSLTMDTLNLLSFEGGLYPTNNPILLELQFMSTSATNVSAVLLIPCQLTTRYTVLLLHSHTVTRPPSCNL